MKRRSTDADGHARKETSQRQDSTERSVKINAPGAALIAFVLDGINIASAGSSGDIVFFTTGS